MRIFHLAVDSMSFSSTATSYYYARTLELMTGECGCVRNRDLIRHYLKQTIAAEAMTCLIAAVKFRYGPANDYSDFIPILEEIASARQAVELVIVDKGYDSERNHEHA